MVKFANKDRTKVRTGIVLDSYITDRLDSIVISSRDLGCTRSEVINAILNAFFYSDVKHLKQARGFVIGNRRGLYLKKKKTR